MVTVHKMYVTKVSDPTNGKVATVSYDDEAQDINILYNGFHFEAEAIHLGAWAMKNGYILETKIVGVRFD